MIVSIFLIAIALASGMPESVVPPTKIASPGSMLTSDNWQVYSSKFMSNIGTIHHNLRYPQA